MAKKTFFVTGTDTDAGKTTVSAGLLEKANQQGLRCFGLKPVAAGCDDTPEGLRNDDALRHLAASNVALDYAEVNPITLAPPIAPHIAAEQEGRRLSAERISGLVRGSLFHPADFVLVEGAGGWRVPLNNRETFADVAKQLQVPVILVVGMKLGCINHALLTAEAIVRDGCTLVGWVANQVDPDMACFDENLATLKNAFRAPLLGVVSHLEQDDAPSVAKFLSIDALLE
jgi:dethiobiotin synthetase